ncbi:MAG: hypothetical protein V9H69_03610 [Anaerolineae bacterium]
MGRKGLWRITSSRRGFNRFRNTGPPSGLALSSTITSGPNSAATWPDQSAARHCASLAGAVAGHSS